ncbi:DUF1572 family protein [Niabella beijingensis]|uniref:DUF1572 family protein n=1 Tax=Niabella beijingensis TaxID=2872700 RepID=UPI001CC1A0F7|nr:DUF1572 family protein [Niabella beijingensis]MBZ4191017.1 DUF1572 domain-containing protein [Niabella beijingensis]
MKEDLFIKSAIQQFKDYKALAERTFAQLNEADFHFQPDTANNNLAVNITHLHGNMRSRWTNFLTEDGEKEWRSRDAEFEEQHLDHTALLRLWEEGWKCLLGALESLRPEDLEKTVTIRTKPLTVIEAIHRQLAHYSYHVGQIVFIGKHIRKDQWQDLSIAKGQSAAYNDQMKTEIK